MKKLLMIIATLLIGAAPYTASAKPKTTKQIVTTVFQTDITCESCKKKIMNTIPYENGIKDVQVDVPTKRVTVTYDASKNTEESLVEAFAKIRVKAVKIPQQ